MFLRMNKMVSSGKQNSEVNIIPRLSTFSYLIPSWRTATNSAVIAFSTMLVDWYKKKPWLLTYQSVWFFTDFMKYFLAHQVLEIAVK